MDPTAAGNALAASRTVGERPVNTAGRGGRRRTIAGGILGCGRWQRNQQQQRPAAAGGG
jgi:hypothetical protein